MRLYDNKTINTKLDILASKKLVILTSTNNNLELFNYSFMDVLVSELTEKTKKNLLFSFNHNKKGC